MRLTVLGQDELVVDAPNVEVSGLQTAGWTYSIGVRQQPHVKAAIAAIPEHD